MKIGQLTIEKMSKVYCLEELIMKKGKFFRIGWCFCIFAVMSLLIIGCSAYEQVEPIPTTQFSSSPQFYPQAMSRLAILVQAGKEVPLRQIENEFILQLMSKGYQIASRSDLSGILEEINFQHSAITDTDAVKIGKILNVPAVLIITPMSKFSMGARLVSVEYAEILWIGTASYAYNVGYQELAKAIAKAFPSR